VACERVKKTFSLHRNSFHNGIAFDSFTNSVILNGSCDRSEHKISAMSYPVNELNNYSLLRGKTT